MSDKPKVAVTRRLPEPVEIQMGELFDVTLNKTDQALSREQLIEAVGTADALAPTVTDVIDADIINAAGPGLKIIANFGVGVNHIDLAAAAARGIKVTNTPDVLTEDTADLTMALILMTPRRLGEGERMVRAGDWTGWTPTQLVGRRISGKRLGIIGMGRIGQAVARRAAGFGMDINYHNRTPLGADEAFELGATYWTNLDEMLGEMDFVSINCPQTDETFHLLSAGRLSLMQPHCYVINTARGGIIDEAALADALEAGAIAGAGLDVFEAEPAVSEKLLTMENVVLLPHLGSATTDGRVAMGQKVINNISACFKGDRLPDLVS